MRWSIGFISYCVASAIAAMSTPSAAAPLTSLQQLGKSLFFDETLSHGGNQSCGSCHSSASAFTDPNKANATSAGSNPALFGSRNAPTAMYMAYSPDFHFDADEGLWIGGQFTDGRAINLEAQARQPFLNPIEMGNADIPTVIARLGASTNAAAFKQQFGDDVLSDPLGAFGKIAEALAAYERSTELAPFSSKFDAYLDGHATLTNKETRGFQVFNDPMKGNCAACHISAMGDDGSHPLFTDFTYDNIGMAKNYANPFLTDPFEFNPDGAAFVDRGLGAIVDDPTLYGAFKVTTLRNVALTAPYGHNGYFSDLEQVVDFYSTRDLKPVCSDSTVSASMAQILNCWAMPEFGETMNVDELGSLNLSSRDKSDLIAFLNTLTDGYQATAVPEPSTWAMIIGFGMVGQVALRARKRKAERPLLSRP